MSRTAAVLALTIAILAGHARAQTANVQAVPKQVGIDYPILVVRMPIPVVTTKNDYPDAFNMSLAIAPGAELVILYPDGKEEVLFSAGPTASCTDPFVSYDGNTVYFVVFEDPANQNPQRFITKNPAHIWKIDLVTRQATQLTHGTEVSWRETANKVDPGYGVFNVAPVELPDGRILFLSTRDGNFSVSGRWPAPAFWRMNPDGSNPERMEWFSMAGCQHPMMLKDGRVVWTHRHDAGRRNIGGHSYPMMIASQDLSDFKPFAGMHARASAWHFAAELTTGDIVTTAYYHSNNFGHGAFVRFPLDPAHRSGNLFGPVAQNPLRGQSAQYGANDSYPRLGERLATPWLITPLRRALTSDTPAPSFAGGEHTGKVSMPAAAPGGHMLMIWSVGGVHYPEVPLTTVSFARNGWVLKVREIVVLKSSRGHQYLHPKPLVPYQAIHGVQRPARQLDTPNDGRHPVLPAGASYATTGTSSLYNRESHWPLSYTDEWSQKLVNNFAQQTAFYTVGQDTYPFTDDRIHAAQIVVDMARVDTRNVNLYSDIKSHNNGQQLWAVLGEIPVRKFTTGGQPILDPQGNPDTSYEVRIPANVPFHHRLLDRNGLMLTAEQTWHSARAGERKTNCGGCHAHSSQTMPLSFSQTFAGQPGYPVTDFALQTPMVDEDTQGNSTVVVRPQKARLVEYYADVKPIFDAKCVSCHQPGNLQGGLDLADPNAWDTLAFKRDPMVPWASGHQATRYVRKNAATQSSLAWKVFGARLDGRTNASRSNDWDYTGTIMPPPGSPPLTFAEKRTIALWIDLGCLVDLTPGTSTTSDPYDDQMRPPLVLSGINTDFNEYPLPPLVVSAYDLHSGIDPMSLSVVVTPNGGQPSNNVAAGLPFSDGEPLSVGLPLLPPDLRHTIDISVADLAGNVSRRRLEVTPLSLRYRSTPWMRNAWVTWNVEGARPGELVHFFVSSVGPGVGPTFLGLQLDLLFPVFLGSATADANGKAERKFFVPPSAPQLVYHSQVVAIRSGPGETSVKSRPLWQELK